MQVTKQELLWIFDYDAERGVLLWKNHWNSSQHTLYKGKIAGTFDRKGYRVVKLNQTKYKIHKLIYFIETGEYGLEIDHINGVVDDNRFLNLRAVSSRQNSMNKYFHRQGKLVGASKRRGKWRSRIHIEGREIYLGTFDTELEAHQEYMKAVREYDAT